MSGEVSEARRSQARQAIELLAAEFEREPGLRGNAAPLREGKCVASWNFALRAIEAALSRAAEPEGVSSRVCLCGDYRWQHQNDGPSSLNWSNPAGARCEQFRPATENSDAR